jgi:arylsulfatase A
MPTPRPNILLILADDMGYGDLACVNGGLSYTPVLDALAGESLCLTQSYSTSSVCAPARAGLLTGRYAQRTGCIDLDPVHGLSRLSLRETTIGDVFAANGYATGLVGKWHTGDVYDSRFHPNRRGFREFFGFSAGATHYYDPPLDCNGTPVKPDGRYLTDRLTDEALAFIDRHSQEPFFLHLAHYAPHRPLEAPSEIVERHLERTPSLTRGQATVYAMIEVMDRGIGRIRERLRTHGLDRNTLIVFSSDNGPDIIMDGALDPKRFNCGLSGHKYTINEGGIRVPLLVHWPDGLARTGSCHDLFHFTDLMPTLLAAAGIALPAGLRLDGCDQLPMLQGETGSVNPIRFWQWNRYEPRFGYNAAMRDSDWKLVLPYIPAIRRLVPESLKLLGELHQAPPGHRHTPLPPPVPDLPDPSAPELYHIADDPCETKNLADVETRRRDHMFTALEAWFHDVENERKTITDE